VRSLIGEDRVRDGVVADPVAQGDDLGNRMKSRASVSGEGLGRLWSW
jgi:hypothetical protein